MLFVKYPIEIDCLSNRQNPPEFGLRHGAAWMDAFAEAVWVSMPAIDRSPMRTAGNFVRRLHFEADWNGGRSKDDIQINRDDRLMPMTHFGSGILTFHVGYLFQNEPGLSLMAQGRSTGQKMQSSACRCHRDRLVALYLHDELVFTRADTPDQL